MTTFGGPQAHIAHFLKVLVQKRNYLSEEDLMEINSLCQVLPGPTSTQTLTAIGYKIGGPTIFGRTDDADLRRFFEGCGYQPHFVEGTEPAVVHEALASTLDECHATIREIWDGARTGGRAVTRPRWPA